MPFSLPMPQRQTNWRYVTYVAYKYNIHCCTSALSRLDVFADKSATVVVRLLLSPVRGVLLPDSKFLFVVSVLRRRRVTWRAARAPILTAGNDPGAGRERRRLDGDSVIVDGRRLVEREDTSPADDAAQWKAAIADRRLDRSHETSTTRDAVSAWESLHRRRCRQTHYTLAYITVTVSR